jgi:hypothetical protein
LQDDIFHSFSASIPVAFDKKGASLAPSSQSVMSIICGLCDIPTVNPKGLKGIRPLKKEVGETDTKEKATRHPFHSERETRPSWLWL